jgi:hypothetical protein
MTQSIGLKPKRKLFIRKTKIQKNSADSREATTRHYGRPRLGGCTAIRPTAVRPSPRRLPPHQSSRQRPRGCPWPVRRRRAHWGGRLPAWPASRKRRAACRHLRCGVGKAPAARSAGARDRAWYVGDLDAQENSPAPPMHSCHQKPHASFLDPRLDASVCSELLVHPCRFIGHSYSNTSS